MLYYSFINLLSISIAFLGSYYLTKDILLLKPESVIKLSKTVAGSNTYLMEVFIRQKADNFFGIFFMFFALIIQYNSINIYSDIILFENFLSGIIIIFRILIFLFIISYFANNFFYKSYSKKVSMYVAKNKLSDFIRNYNNNVEELSNIVNRSMNYIDFKKIEGETSMDLLKRYASFLDVDIPKNYNLE